MLPLAADLERAQRSGEFPVSTDRFVEWRDLRRYGLHVYIECEIYGTAIRYYEDPLAQAITPLQFGPPPDSPGRTGPCENLLEFSKSGFPREWGGFRRHRYLHGLLPVVEIGSRILGMVKFRRAVVWATYVLASLAVWGAVLRWRRTKSRPSAGEAPTIEGVEPVLLLVLVSVFFVVAGFPFHARTVSHGVPNLVLLALLVLASFTSLLRLRLRWLILGSAVFGVLLVHLDQMIGASPLGLALLLGVVALEHPEGKHWRPTALRALGAGTGFVSGAIGAILSKQIVAFLYFGQGVWESLWHQLALRSGYSQYTFSEAARSFGRASRYLAFGDQALGLLVLVGALLISAFPFLAVVALRVPVEAKRQLGMLALSSGVIAVWYLVFWNHSVQFAYFMISLIGWPTAVGAASIVIAARSRSRLSITPKGSRDTSR